jgi:hypothetical protein
VIFRDGFVPNKAEVEKPVNGVPYVFQRAERLSDGKVRCYHVKKFDWANVGFTE